MRKAEKHPFIDFLVSKILQNLTRQIFSSVLLKVDLEVFQNKENLPTIYYANHTTRWDHHLSAFITEKLWKQVSYTMVAEGLMDQYNFIRFTGSYSIDNSSPYEVAQAIKYTKELLDLDTKPVIWIFPQGNAFHPDMRPLGLQTGLAQLVRSIPRVRLVPVAFRYEFVYVVKPRAYINFGKPKIFSKQDKLSTRSITESLEAALVRELDNQKADIMANSFNDYVMVDNSGGLFITKIWHSSSKFLKRFVLPVLRKVKPKKEEQPV
jgi:hypothetical protein